ncbi:extracellular solute-binding protein [Cohnella nanjingensis]|uniref:Extracellular solute-binding protein n=1 Tax=Cohnella nanjingensis TaxID=1387779 RepID=A0A7X0RUA4_9BACL|nr:extracellular solute-binding protein [Cohnella nanjingensis]MBB6673817.1 extracellular solute-binding protein [Cohnella nanjingensis]
MKSRNRKASQALISLLLIAVIAGCSGSKNGSPTPNGSAAAEPTASGSPAEKAPKERMKLQFWSQSPEKVVPASHAVQAVEDQYNVDIEILPRNNETYVQKLQLSITSGNAPDWFSDLDFKEYDKLVDQGVLAEIPPELLEEYAPNYMKWIKKELGDDPFRYTMRNGKNYAMPSVWTLGSKATVVGIRQDWLNKVGIDKVPETLEELEAAMVKFRNDDPDGNGKKDTYGMTGKTDYIEDFFSPIFGAYGVYPGIFTEKDGKAVLGEIEPGAKEALALLNKWYKEGLIDPEFVINKGNNVDDKVISEKVGVVTNYWWKFTPAEAFFGGLYYDKLIANNPNAKWATIGGPKGPGGDFGADQSNPVLNSGLLFSKQVDRDKMIKYIQIFEATSFDLDLYEKINYGEEGKTFKKNNGDIEWIPPYDKEEERIKYGAGFVQLPGSFNDYDLLMPYMTKSKYRELRKEAESKGTGKYNLLNPIERPVFNEYKDRLDQFTKKNLVDFITGKRSVDEFDKYVEEWKQIGGDKVMAEAQQKYEEVFKE